MRECSECKHEMESVLTGLRCPICSRDQLIKELQGKVDGISSRDKTIKELHEQLGSKVTITFDDPEDAKVAMDGWKYKHTIDDIWNEVFRPIRKHGYNNRKIEEILDGLQCGEENVGYELIEHLIEIYFEVVREDE